MGQNGKMVPKVLIPDSATKRVTHEVRKLLDQNTTNDSISAKVMTLNSLIRGWCQYYCSTSSPSKVFHRLEHEIFWGMAHWLGRKYKVSTPAVMRKYRRENTFGTKRTKLVQPTEYKAKRLKTTPWHNPYTAKEEILREKLFSVDNYWSGYEDRQGWMDLREEVMLLKGTTCYVCGIELHPSEVEVDHTIPRTRFKDKTEADRMKHLQPICTSCHRAKTQTDLKVLSRMR